MQSAKKGYLRYIAIILAFVLFVSAVLFGIDLWEKRHNLFFGEDVNPEEGTASFDGQDYVKKEQIQTILVLGLDEFEEGGESESYNNNREADFIMLLALDEKNGTCAALQINRDTMAEMNILGVAGDKVGSTTKQIALAHTYGNGKEVSCRNVADAVSKLLFDVKIDHYLSVPMDAVADLTDLVGGVEVQVLDDFTGIDDTLIKGEKVVLRGEQALRYVRTRYGLEDSTNTTRMGRQKQFMQALYQKARLCAEADGGFVTNAALKLSEYTVSDCSGNQLQSLFEKLSDYELGEIRALEGNSVKGETNMEFYPDRSSVIETVVDLFYEVKD